MEDYIQLPHAVSARIPLGTLKLYSSVALRSRFFEEVNGVLTISYQN